MKKTILNSIVAVLSAAAIVFLLAEPEGNIVTFEFILLKAVPLGILTLCSKAIQRINPDSHEEKESTR